MNTQVLDNAKVTEDSKFTITVTETADFPNLIKGGLITSYELMEKVSEFFSAAYKDFTGCFITPRSNGQGFDTKLYFGAPATDNAGATYAFELNGNQRHQQKSGLIAGLTSIERRSSQKIYTMTQHGREGLVDFLSIPRGKQPDWKQFISEEMQNSNINAGIYALVSGIDIIKILATIYGEKEDGDYLQYQLTPIRPLSQNNAIGAALDWILSIQRLGMKELNSISRKVGIVQSGGIPMVGRH